MADRWRNYLNPDILSSITNLDLRARRIVEGFISGLHKSPFRGFSVEFAEHREYSPGDEIKHIDWKVWGKSDRYVIKEYEEETNLSCTILLDVSESMRYGSGSITKLDYAGLVAASLSYLLLKQKDSVGIAYFDDSIRKRFRPSNRMNHLRDMFTYLAEEVRPTGKTDVASTFHQIAEESNRRGMIVLISDMFADIDDLINGLKHFRFKRNEVLVIQILDEAERTFPFERQTLFHGLEQTGELLTNPKSLRRGYLRVLNRFLQDLESRCRSFSIDFLSLSTSDPLEVALAHFLAQRANK
jgi:uncharacterized protein (DUF58 family)